MNDSRKLSQLEENKMVNYSNRNWDDLEDEEQLNYSLLIYKKEGIINDNSVYAIRNKIEEYRTSPQVALNIEFDKLAYAYLSKANIYQPREYMYLSWLYMQHKWDSNINNPIEPKQYNLTLDKFTIDYAYNKERQYLLSNLISFTNDLKLNIHSDDIQILVGGSFTTPKEKPSDIDFAVIFKKLTNFEFDLNDELYRLNYSIPFILDFHFIPNTYNNYNLSFYEYNIINRLGNKAAYTDKSSKFINNNTFDTIPLIKITI